jgi:hypothetical protein
VIERDFKLTIAVADDPSPAQDDEVMLSFADLD